MDYITAKEAADKWDISLRSVQAYCIDGKIPGATRIANAWVIPADAEKPKRAKTKKTASNHHKVDVPEIKMSMPMPLLNTAFELGKCEEEVGKIHNTDMHNIAMAEYHYFSGKASKAAKIVEKYLQSDDLGLRLSACWIYAYSNLALDDIKAAKLAMGSLKEFIASLDENTPAEIRSLVMFVSTAASVLLHLPLEYEIPPMGEFIGQLPPGLRLFALYIYAHYAYLEKAYAASAGVAETALALETKVYPIPTIYLHLVAAMDYMCLKMPEAAKKHMLSAWEIAKADELIEPFGEHHGLVGGMIEAVIKKESPEQFKKIIAITYKFAAGWRKIHNPHTGNNVADGLSTTEFAVSMLVSKNYSNKEISAILNISENTVKSHVQNAMAELGISDRRDLKKFMLS